MARQRSIGMGVAMLGLGSALVVSAAPPGPQSATMRSSLPAPSSRAAGRGPSNVGSAATNPGEIAGWAAGYGVEVAGIKPKLMNLWEGEAPNQVKNAAPERNDGERIWTVNVPGMLVYLPSKEKLAASGGVAGGACIIACPGGAYSHLTRLVGGDGTVEEFVPRGIAVVSLKNRLMPPSSNPERDAVEDGKRAVRLVRTHAKEWGIDPHKVGMMGWSAGGNLIVSLCTHLEKGGAGDPRAKDPVERENCRPDFVALWSPWPNGRKIDAYMPAKDVSLPPAMIGGAQDDTTAPFVFVSGVKEMWEKAGGKAELLVQPTGRHGAFELNLGSAKDWPTQFLPWMEKQGFWKPIDGK